jgi:hypothetical protein
MRSISIAKGVTNAGPRSVTKLPPRATALAREKVDALTIAAASGRLKSVTTALNRRSGDGFLRAELTRPSLRVRALQ